MIQLRACLSGERLWVPAVSNDHSPSESPEIFDFIPIKRYNNKIGICIFLVFLIYRSKECGLPLSPSAVHYRITFPADYKNVAPLRDLAARMAEIVEFDHKTVERVRSVVDELCNNAIEYGSQPTSEVILELHADQKNIKIACLDQGHGNKLTAKQIQDQLHQVGPEGGQRGRGLSMVVKSFADEFLIEDRKEGGVKVTALVHRQIHH
ncbi:MAG: ATP-binding protein [bacterium]|nr:ATP-binding protein [bacterium]